MHAYFQIFAAIMFSALLIQTGRLLASEHPSRVGVVWYAFSLAFCLMIVAHVAVASLNIQQKFPMGYSVVMWWFNASTDVDNEFGFFIYFLLLIIIPQVLAYGFSGLFGCAYQPVFVAEFTTVVAWLIIKLMAAAAGIELERGIFFSNNPFNTSGAARYTHFLSALSLLTIGFIFLFIHLDRENMVTKLQNAKWARPLRRVNSWMRRNLKETSAPGTMVTIQSAMEIAQHSTAILAILSRQAKSNTDDNSKATHDAE